MASSADGGSSQVGEVIAASGKVLRVVVSLLPAATALLISTVLVLNSELKFTSLTDPATLNSLALVAIFLLASLGVGYGVRYLLPPDRLFVAPGSAAPARDGAVDHNRDRIARYVVTAGTLSISGIALTIIIAIAIKGGNWEERALSIFASVLPVFSTWVGTVLAFYFTNESRRQAAVEAREARGAADEGEPITRPGIMVPFDAIPRLELTSAQIAGRDTKVAAEELALKTVTALFGAGIRRVVIFDDKKAPVFVVHRSGLPDDLNLVLDSDTLSDYLDEGSNRDAARNFAPAPATGTVTDARRLVELRRVTDLFVTDHGRNDEPTIGWVPDANLKRP